MAMLYQKTLTIIILCGITASCQYGETSPEEEARSADTISYSFDLISRELPCEEKTEEPCLDIKIKKITLQDGPSAAALKEIESSIKKAVVDTDNSPGEVKDPEQLAENLLAEYKRITKEMPDYSMPWSYERNIDVFLNRQGLFGVELDAYSYTGGAHGNYFTFYYIYDTDNGKRIELHDLLIDGKLPQLLRMSEEQFRQSRGLNTEMDLNEAGYWFEENTFALPENFKYSGEGLEFRYNPYEIAPYSEGEITLIFPLSSVKGLIKAEYRVFE